MTHILSASLACSALGFASAGAAPPPKVPPGKWAIEYQEDTCTLSRDGTGGQRGIAIRIRPLTDPHELMFYGQFDHDKRDGFQGTIHFDGQEQGAARWVLIKPSGGRKRTLIETTISAEELGRLAKASTLGIRGAAAFQVDAVAPGVAKALTALRECEVHLAGRWGITPAEMNSWARPARPLTDLRELFWDKDMSKVGMLREAMRGVLTIDAAGRITDCKIVTASKVSWVNARFCPTLRERAQFEPARNSAGDAVPGKFITPRITSARLR